MKSPELTPTFAHDLYLSSRALVTLNDGDPKNAASQFLSVCEGGLGLAFLGLVVGYLPVLYQSFAKRELVISLLDARAGSPPSAGGLLASTAVSRPRVSFSNWSGGNRGWRSSSKTRFHFRCSAISGLSTRIRPGSRRLSPFVDYATVIGIVSEGTLRLQADLTAAMGRHVLSDVVVIFGLEQSCEKKPSSRLSGRAEQLRGVLLQRPGMFDASKLSNGALNERVAGYEPQARR